MGTTGQVVHGQILLTWWQVDEIGPLAGSEGYKNAITCVDMASELFGTYPACHPDQKAVIAALEHVCAAYGWPLIIESDRGGAFYRGLGATMGKRHAD